MCSTTSGCSLQKLNENETNLQWMEFLVPVELFRDGVESPWGFRLRGGSDVEGGTPLEIIKVFVGGASEGLLQVGDRILSINNQNAEQISHFEAQHLFKSSGTNVKLHVLRLVQYDTNRVLSNSNSSNQKCKNQWNELAHGTGANGFRNQPSPFQPQTNSMNFQQQASYLHLPSPKESSFAKPNESETFKIIMREEIAYAKDQNGIAAKKFDKSQSNRPLSQLSDNSDESKLDPVLKNTSINQSTSFKKLMNSVMGETEF